MLPERCEAAREVRAAIAGRYDDSGQRGAHLRAQEIDVVVAHRRAGPGNEAALLLVADEDFEAVPTQRGNERLGVGSRGDQRAGIALGEHDESLGARQRLLEALQRRDLSALDVDLEHIDTLAVGEELVPADARDHNGVLSRGSLVEEGRGVAPAAEEQAALVRPHVERQRHDGDPVGKPGAVKAALEQRARLGVRLEREHVRAAAGGQLSQVAEVGPDVDDHTAVRHGVREPLRHEALAPGAQLAQVVQVRLARPAQLRIANARPRTGRAGPTRDRERDPPAARARVGAHRVHPPSSRITR